MITDSVGAAKNLGYCLGKVMNYVAEAMQYLPSMGMHCNKYMDEMLNSYDNKSPPIEIAARLHWGFVKIHPFNDRNGRTVRLLMLFIFRKHGYSEDFCRSLNSYLDQNQKIYHNALVGVKVRFSVEIYDSFDNVTEDWLQFMRNCVEEVQNKLIRINQKARD